MIDETVLLLTSAEPAKLPPTRKIILIKPVGTVASIAMQGNAQAVYADAMTLDDVLATLEREGLRNSITRVVCVDEQYILLAAKVREALSLSGQSFMSARAFRNKLFMKEYLKTASSFRLPAFWSPLQRRSREDIFPLDAHGAVVRKPILGSGGIGVKIYDNISQVDDVAQDEMLESFIDLPMLHVDGLVVNGEIGFFVISRYINSCLSFNEFKYVGSEFSHDESLNRRAEVAMREVFRLLPAFQDGAFHLEMFYSDTELYFCEIASRPGGIGVVSALQEAYGINLYHASYAAQCGTSPHLPTARRAETSWLLVPHGLTLSIDYDSFKAMPWIVECSVDDAAARKRSLHCADGQFKAVLRGDSLFEVVSRREALLASIGYHETHEGECHEYQ